MFLSYSPSIDFEFPEPLILRIGENPSVTLIFTAPARVPSALFTRGRCDKNSRAELSRDT